MIYFSKRQVIIAASGPSLSTAQMLAIHAHRDLGKCWLIAVNDTYKNLTNADILYAADRRWWKVHMRDITKLERAGAQWQRWSCDNTNKELGVNIIKAIIGQGLAPVGSKAIHKHHSSGHQALGMAVLWGAKHIILVGFDCKAGEPTKEEPDGKTHFFGKHPATLPNPQPFNLWLPDYGLIATHAKERGIRIANCSLDSAIPFFERCNLADELQYKDES